MVFTWCGITILRRTTTDNRFQVLLPSGSIFGIALYIFLINLIAHIIKGAWGFYIAIVIEIFIAVLIKKLVKTEPISFPKKRNYFLFLLTLITFIPFLVITSAQGPANTADSFMHYSLAAVFQRGDYPPHVPWQPDYISYYHLGVAEILGAMRAITSASYELLFSFLELIILSCIVMILPWLYIIKKPNFLLFFATAAFGILSLGSFWFAWPVSISFPQTDLFTWLKHLPTLADVPANGYGTQNNLLSFMLFSHRIVVIAFSIVIAFLLISPSKNKILYFATIILLSAIALTDETAFLSIAPAIFLVSFFTIFKKSLLKFLLFSIICLSIVILQGGILSYIIFNPNHTQSDILIYPPDQTGPQALYEHYRTDRLNSLGSTLIKTKSVYPLRFFNLGIIWRITLITLIALFLLYKYYKTEPILIGISIFCLSSILSLIEFVVIVPKGYLHANGSRFLGLSYYFSALVIIYLISFFWEKSNYSIKIFKWPFNLLKISIIWILFITITPSIAILFPLQSYNWFLNSAETKVPFYTWIGKNIPQWDRLLLLTANAPIASTNLSLIIQEGAFTPIWPPQIRSFYGVDTSPTFFDIFYTLNPSALKLLKVKYIVVSKDYVSQLPLERVRTLNNRSFFEPIYLSEANDLVVLKIQDKYFAEKDLEGTFAELSQKAPLGNSYYIEDPPAIPESIYRATRLTLVDRKIYFNKSVAFYNYQLDAELKYYGESADYYDYLILGKNTDPSNICHCKAELFWSGLGENLKLWKTEKPNSL